MSVTARKGTPFNESTAKATASCLTGNAGDRCCVVNYFFNVDWSKVNSRWVSCFDLLGFGDRVNKSAWPAVVSLYSQCLDEFTQQVGQQPKIGCCWFSDTFLLYAHDNAPSAFTRIEQLSRLFMRSLLQKQIPVRGAISCEEFFADKPHQIFLGKALVESHHYGERYNWIGLVMCPSAEVHLKTFSQLPLGNYRKWDAEYKAGEGFKKEAVWAYPIGAEIPLNGQNCFIGILQSMAEQCSDPKIRRKYQNTIRFLEHYGVWLRIGEPEPGTKPTCATSGSASS